MIQINLICDLLNIECEYLNSEIESERSQGHVSATSIYRLVFFDLMPDSFVYIDVDTLPRPGWDSILETQFDNSAFVVRAAPDWPERVAHQRKYWGDKKTMGLKFNHAYETEFYFNSGVMVVNPSLWRKKV